VIQILLIAAPMLVAPASFRAYAVEIVRLEPAEPRFGGPVATGAVRSSDLLVAQNTAASAAIPGTYAGEVDRRYISGDPQATRTYRLTMNPDMNTGKVLIYELDGKLRNESGWWAK
jgi:hypothetical protein